MVPPFPGNAVWQFRNQALRCTSCARRPGRTRNWDRLKENTSERAKVGCATTFRSDVSELFLELTEQAASQAGVPIETEPLHGPVIDKIIEVAEEREVQLIVMRASNGFILERWLSSEIRESTRVPVRRCGPYSGFGEITDLGF